MQDLEIEVIDHADAVVVYLRGEMGLKLDGMEVAFERVAARKPPLVVVDLSGLSFVSSLAMGLLVALRGGTRHQSSVRLAGAKGMVRDSLARARLTDLFEMYDSTEKALAAGKPGSARK